MSNMTCAEARALVQLRMDGPLDAARAVEVERHLAFPDDALEEVLERTVGSAEIEGPRWLRAPWLAAAAALLLGALLLPWLAFGPTKPTSSHTDAELDAARQQLELVLGITGRAIERGGARGVERALQEGVAPALGATGARVTELILEEKVAPTLERLPLLSSTPVRSATPPGDHS